LAHRYEQNPVRDHSFDDLVPETSDVSGEGRWIARGKDAWGGKGKLGVIYFSQTASTTALQGTLDAWRFGEGGEDSWDE